MTMVGRPHPLRAETIQCQVPEGLTLAEMLRGLDLDRLGVRVGGAMVPRDLWKYTKPKAGTLIEVVALPAGGGRGSGGKTALLVVAMLAVTVMSYGATAGWFGFMGAGFAAGSWGATALGVGIALGGSLAMRALIKPPKPPKAEQSPYGLTASGNAANPYGVVPIVLGDTHMFPALAAKPYTEILGQDNFIRLLYDLGHGSIVVDEEKFGTVDLAEYDTNSLQYEQGVSPTLYTKDFEEVQVGREMTDVMANWTITTVADVDQISLDLSFPSGLFCNEEDGGTGWLESRFKVEYKEIGQTQWKNVLGAGNTIGTADAPGYGTTGPDMTADLTTFSEPLFRVSPGSGVRRQFSVGLYFTPVRVASGTYEVRVTHIGAYWYEAMDVIESNADQNKWVRKNYWTMYRMIRNENPSTTGTTKVAMRFKATREVNGQLEQYNLRARQIIPVWNGSTWAVPAAPYTGIDNPAAIVRWLFTACPENRRQVPGSKLDDVAFQSWYEQCATKGFKFGYVIDQPMAFRDVISMVCAAGRATFIVRDGKYSVVQDLPQSTPVQFFTPRNSWDFNGARVFHDTVHALRCTFRNSSLQGWPQDERIVYDDGYNAANATKIETMDFRGSIHPDAVWRLARYHMAVGRLRQNEYTFKADVEHLVCQRGDLIKVSHDLVRWGLGWGRIASLPDSTTILVDADLDDLVAGASYTLRVRKQDSTSVVYTAVKDATNPRKLTVAAGHSGLNFGDLVMLGEPGQESKNLIVTKITPGPDMSAVLTCHDEAPAVYTADDTAGMPAFVSNITGSPWFPALTPPQIAVTYVTAENLSDEQAGYTQPEPAITITVPSGDYGDGVTYDQFSPG